MKHAILLGGGLVLTLLFLIFPAAVYELGYYQNEFSNEMYNENLYLITALITACCSWGGAVLFYYVINSVSFSRWFHWLIVLAVVSVLAAVCGYAYANSVLDGLGYDFESQLSGFSVVNFVIAALLYVVASFSMRWWSSNCRHTPIPE